MIPIPANRIFPISAAMLLLSACGPIVVWHGHSADRLGAAKVLESPSSGKQLVVHDGRAGKVYEGVGLNELSFSPDGRRLAYPALSRGRWLVVIDGEESDGWDGVAELTWSADGEHIAFAAQRDGSWYVVRDGRARGGWDAILRDTLTFGNDGNRLAYVAERDDRLFVAVDESVAGPYDEVADLAVAESGARVGYLARTGDAAFAVIDGKRGAPHERIRSLVLAPRGRRAGYFVREAGLWHTVIDGEMGPAYERLSGLRFSPDASRYAYIASRGTYQMVVVDGVEGDRYDAVREGTLRFGTGDNLVSYVARRGPLFVVVHDGRPGPAFESVETPVFSASGGRWGYIGHRTDSSVVMIDGHLLRRERWATGMIWSPDGRRHAYVARRGKRTVIVQQRGVFPFDAVVTDTLVFSEDGGHWSCLVGDSDNKEIFITIDGKERRPFDMDEFMAALMRDVEDHPTDRQRNALLRRWVAAELELATSSRIR